MGEENVLAEKETVNTTMKNFMYNLVTRSPQQHVELINAFSGFCECFKDTEKYLDKIKIIEETPVEFFIEEKKDYFSKEELRNIDRGYRLPEMDFLYFRDTQFNKKLKTKYPTSTKSKRRYQKKLVLAQLLDILSHIRKVLYSDLVKIANENDFEIPMVLPAVDTHSNAGVGIGTETGQKPSNF